MASMSFERLHCPECEGTGKAVDYFDLPDPPYDAMDGGASLVRLDCRRCDGRYFRSDPCPVCDGRLFVLATIAGGFLIGLRPAATEG